jgi:hypothetical protein
MAMNQSPIYLDQSGLNFPPPAYNTMPQLPDGGSKRTRRMRSMQGQLGGNDKKKGKNRSRGKTKSKGKQVQDLTGHPDEFLELEKSGAPPFLVKTYQLITTCNDDLADWSDGGETFTVKDTVMFAKEEIPKYFEHNNFSSFSRQLNFYGFKKVPQKTVRIDQSKTSTGYVRFHNEKFKRGRIGLLHGIQRSTKTGVGFTNQSHEVKALTSRVASLETQLSNMKYDFESLKAQVSSFLYQQGAASHGGGQEQSQMPMQHASAMRTNVNYYEPTQQSYGNSTTTAAGTSTTATEESSDQAPIRPDELKDMPPPPMRGISRLLSAGFSTSGSNVDLLDGIDFDNDDFLNSGPERVSSYAAAVDPSVESSNLQRMTSLTLQNEAPMGKMEGRVGV